MSTPQPPKWAIRAAEHIANCDDRSIESMASIIAYYYTQSTETAYTGD